MKKLLFVTITLLSSMYVSGQVKSFSVEGSKIYDDGRRTSYLQVDADIDFELAEFIEQELMSFSEIMKVSFYASGDLSRVMFTSQKVIDEDIFVEMMNEVIAVFQDSEPLPDRVFAGTGWMNGQFMVRFTLDVEDNRDLMNQIEIFFKESDIITDVNYKGNSTFEIFSHKEVFPHEVEDILEDMEIKILPEFIRSL